MSIRELLARSVVLFDGAMGTMLIAAGMRRGECSERFTLERGELVESIHRSYVDAGADVVCACTFGATSHHLRKHGLEGRLGEINRAAVALARRAAGDRALVAGDIGPTGLMYPPLGSADDALLEELFAEQAEALRESGVDLFLLETHYDIREALCALRAIRRTGDTPVGVTMTFNLKRRGYFTMIGDSVEKCCRALADEGADFIGANCTLAPGDMVSLAQELAVCSALPVLIQPNAGQPKFDGDTIRYDIGPDEFARGVAQILDEPVRAVGGCCGTTPEFIRALRGIVDSRL